ncbi:MAG: response regulator transcription factor [Ruminococcus sp.]|nr:response regulator transcription factor [Ruminococcus sp.]
MVIIMASILIIEDDEQISQLLRSILEESGYVTECAMNGLDGLHLALKKEYNLILMDLMLPLKSGEEVLRELRRSKSTPVVVLSAKNAVYNRIELFRLGADDFISKPFDIDEVTLRIEAVLRRTEGIPAILSFKDMKIDTSVRRVFVGEKELNTTAMEYYLLELMLSHPKKIFSKKNLFESVTGEEYLDNENVMNVHISNLRKKIAALTDEEYIETVYGMGYRLRV